MHLDIHSFLVSAFGDGDAFLVDDFSDIVLTVHCYAAAWSGALVTFTAAFFAGVFFACGEVVVARDVDLDGELDAGGPEGFCCGAKFGRDPGGPARVFDDPEEDNAFHRQFYALDSVGDV